MSTTSDRLKTARMAAGFTAVSSAANEFGWKYSTYAGHENGHRGIKRPDLEKYARAFGVSLGWLLSGRGPMREEGPDAGKPSEQAPGFSEPMVQQFTAKTDTARRRMEEAADLLTTGLRHSALYALNADVPGFLLLKGDTLVVDLHPTPANGDLALVQIVNAEGTYALTELCRISQDRPAPPHGTNSLLDQEHGDVSVMGTVKAIVRLPR